MINFGTVIKKYREALHLTQKDLAEKAEITPAYLSALENDKKEPSLALLEKICRFLDLPKEVFFWEAVEINDGLKNDEKKAIDLAKVIVKHYFENINASSDTA